MARYKVEWTPFASQCLSEIYFYISNREKSEVPADKFIRKLVERTDQLTTHPFTGQAEPHFDSAKKERRYLVEGNYKIISRIEKDTVVITDIFHTKLNPHKLTKRDVDD